MPSTRLNSLLEPLGLDIIGWFEMFDGPATLAGKPAALIGNQGRAMWEVFSKSTNYLEDEKSSLDRWTKANLSPLEVQLSAIALYPFLDGQSQHWPFQQWAFKATGLKQSPQGLIIDPEFGLWQAFRAVLVFDQNIEIPVPDYGDHPCDSCAKKPCLSTCPVDAISDAGFHAGRCIEHVKSQAGLICREKGCIARNACPIGRSHAYLPLQQAFHMKAFIG